MPPPVDPDLRVWQLDLPPPWPDRLNQWQAPRLVQTHSAHVGRRLTPTAPALDCVTRVLQHDGLPTPAPIPAVLGMRREPFDSDRGAHGVPLFFRARFAEHRARRYG